MRIYGLIPGLLFAAACFAGSLLPVIAIAEPLVLATTASMPLGMGDGKIGFVPEVAKSVFKRIGLEAEFEWLPGERALLTANAGIDDGELIRVSGLEKIYTNLIRVPEPMVTMDFAGFTLGKPFPVDGWDSLKPYDVGIISGWKIYEKNIVGVRQLTDVRNIDVLFKLMANGRTDIAMATRWMGQYTMKKLGLSAKILEPPFAQREMFMYLHRKHADLVPKFNKALVEFKRDGSYQRLYHTVLDPYTQ